jgi:glycosyltransferase involved in cell wall biosynthesis
MKRGACVRKTVVISNIRGGGSVWAAVQWANAWSARGEGVSIVVVLPDEGVGQNFALHEKITVVRRDVSERPVGSRLAALRQVAQGLWAMRKAILETRPDVVIAFDGPINTRTLMACFGLRVPVVVMEQAHPAYYGFGRFWERCRDFIYPRAAAVVNLTRTASDWCVERYSPQRVAVIHNPIYPVAGRAQLDHGGPKTLITAARMVEQKRLDLLIQAFARIAAQHPDWRLVIYGDGPDRPELERQAAATGLGQRINMPGWTDALSARMAESDLFVLSSAYEGFGNVIAEALAVGLPVVSFDCPSGPSDIIRHGVDGLLVPPLDVGALALALDNLMADDALRLRMGGRGPEVLERFTMEQTLEKWDELLHDVAPQPGHDRKPVNHA